MQLVVAIAALAVAAQASVIPLVERDPAPRLITVTKVVDVWTTVTVPYAAPSSKNNRWGGKGGNGGVKPPSSPSAAPAAPSPSTPAVQAPPPVQDVPSPVDTQPAPAQTTNAAPPPAATTPAASNSYSQIVVDQHNVHRANHSSPAMTWSQSLADTALKIAQTCVYGHSMNVDGGGYGQNIAAGAPVNAIASVITEQFYNGEVNAFVDYGQATPADFDSNFENYGHFTQVVWVGSTTIGCATVDCTSKGLANVGGNVPPIFHVCNYGPAGNVMGEFDKNVLRSLGEATVNA
jgi:uncharacterized protein YkwD